MARPRKPIEHGTYRGYHQERRRGEYHCARCTDAFNTYQREWWRTRGKAESRRPHLWID